jgi:dTDP-4-amino-4,6-dideoxygalactose transaminase
MSACPGISDQENIEKIAPVASRAVSQMLHLPVYPELKSVEIKFIAKAVRTALGQ